MKEIAVYRAFDKVPEGAQYLGMEAYKESKKGPFFYFLVTATAEV